jgi:hypothetical protein
LIAETTSGLPSKPTTLTFFVRPADFSAATAPRAIVSLPAMTPSMSRLRWRIVSIFVNASC